MHAQIVLDSVYQIIPNYPNDMHAMVVDEDTLVIMQSLYDTTNNGWSINLFKMDTLGNILYSNLIVDSLGAHLRNLWGNKMIKTSDGGYAYAAGYVHNPACEDCIFLAKYKHSGEIDYVKYYQKPDTSYTLFAINNLLQLEDGGYFLFSFYYDENYVSVPHLIRTDAEGTELWSRDYPATGDTSVIFHGVTAIPNQKYILSGLKVNYNGPTPFGLSYMIIIDSLGNIMKESLGEGEANWSDEILPTDDGGYLQLISKTKFTPYHSTKSLGGIRKLDSTLKEEWVRYIDFAPIPGAMYTSLVKTLDGNYVACGPRGLDGTGKTSMHIKISDTGDVIWERFDKAHWNGEEAYVNRPRAIGVLSSGSTVSVGSAFTFSGGELGWVFKITPGGCVYDTVGCWPAQPDATQNPMETIDISVYPNPATDELTIQLTGDLHQKAYIYFYDVTGRFLRKQRLDLTYNILTISDLPKGMIFYTINSTEGVLRHGKLVVDR